MTRKPYKNTMPDAERTRLKAMYEGGATLQQCATALGYSSGSEMARYLRQMGVTIRPKGKHYNRADKVAQIAATLDTHTIDEQAALIGLTRRTVITMRWEARKRLQEAQHD